MSIIWKWPTAMAILFGFLVVVAVADAWCALLGKPRPSEQDDK